VEGLLTIGGGKMSDFRVMAEAVTDLACRRLGRPTPCGTFRETLSGEPLGEPPVFPKPWRPLKVFLRSNPRLRELHALGYLGVAFARHLARRALASGDTATADAVRQYYSA
jgi:glycerol-3-phosphate dehydrogenase